MTPTTTRRGLLTGLALGAPVLAYGVWGALVDGSRTHPPELARWVIGSALAVDLLVVPVAVAAGAVVRRFCPSSWWPTVRAALMATGALALVAWPFVRGDGRDPDNPSLLPRDYAAGLAAAVGLVWAAAAAVIVCRWARSRRRGPARVVGSGGTRY